MKRYYITLFILTLVGLFAISTNWFPGKNWDKNTPVYSVLKDLGENLPDHAREDFNEDKIRMGRELILNGRTIGPNGKKSKFISKFYVCTSCHSVDREDPNLSVFDPEGRLDYVAERGMKFLQGSTFYGIANRESWYNDDYYLKYGDLVKPANKSLAEATQLCAKVCSSGRYLEEWELDAILAFYWSNQIKLGDLDLTDEEIEILKKENSKESVAIIKSKYALKSPATFGEVPENKVEGYKHAGDPTRGKMIFELSCLACHQDQGVAGMPFDNGMLSLQKLKRNLEKNSLYNIYDIVRHGTYVDKGKPRYMPLYPKERLSDKQLEDLRAYILQGV